MAVNSSPFKLVPTLVVVTSTMGDSAVTVTVSASDATFSCVSTVIVCPITTWRFSRSSDVNPERSNFSL